MDKYLNWISTPLRTTYGGAGGSLMYGNHSEIFTPSREIVKGPFEGLGVVWFGKLRSDFAARGQIIPGPTV